MLILERYLYLLTEDPIYDKLDDEYKLLRKKILEKGREAEQLSAQYPDRATRPADVEAKLQAYQKEVDEFSKLSNRRQNYSAWTRSGKKGPNPEGFASGKRYTGGGWEGFRREEEAWARNSARYEEAMRRSEATLKQMKIRRRILGAYFLILVAVYGYLAYMAIAYKECNKYTSERARQKCIILHKIKATNQKKRILISKQNQCSKAKNPDKCRAKIKDEILKSNTKIRKLERQLKQYK